MRHSRTLDRADGCRGREVGISHARTPSHQVCIPTAYTPTSFDVIYSWLCSIAPSIDYGGAGADVSAYRG